MEFVVVSVLVYVIIAWFAVARDMHKNDRKAASIQQFMDDQL